jgi:hypothetical protein
MVNLIFMSFFGGAPTHKMAHWNSGNNTLNIPLYLEDKNVFTIRYSEGFLGQRVGSLGLLAFHPRRLLLAAGSLSSASISLFSGLPKPVPSTGEEDDGLLHN